MAVLPQLAIVSMGRLGCRGAIISGYNSSLLGGVKHQPLYAHALARRALESRGAQVVRYPYAQTQ